MHTETLTNSIKTLSLSQNEIEPPQTFYPPKNFQNSSKINCMALFEEAENDREAFWAKQADTLYWFEKWHTVLQWKPPYAKWFLGGKINACYNCVDRHLADKSHKKALIWEGENGEMRSWTYQELYNEVNKLGNVLKSLGISKDDKVAIYLPMTPEAIAAMLACARIGAVHTVIFGGFSAEALKDRILDAEAKLIITADGGFRKGKIVQLKEAVDHALRECPSINHVLVVKRTGEAVSMQANRDVWYHQIMAQAEAICIPEEMDAEDLLFILYTSGTTGKPKGIMHTTGGYLLGAAVSTKWVFDIQSTDIYWCTADIGWITGHTYVVYGPLCNGMTQLIYEGSPDWPQRNRFWRLIEKYHVTTLYTAPTAIRTFMKWGEEWIKNHDLSSLRLLGSVGEPINPEAWMWYYHHIGQKKCPIVDTWWQTETGSILIAPLPGLTSLKPGSATFPLPGIEAMIVNEDGEEVSSSGNLVITSPWPSMLRGIYKDAARYESAYWKKYNDHYYFTGDGAIKDEEGYFWLLGRVDDVISVSGHRIGSIEVESALVDHYNVAEAAVIAIPHPIKGQAIVAFTSLKENLDAHAQISEILKQHVVEKIGAIAKPEKVIVVHDLPKTRSGKIMRRLLRDIAEGRALGDVSTLADAQVMLSLKSLYKDED